jgi:hypothetical protein
MMCKSSWWRLLGAAALAAGLYWSGLYAGRHPSSWLAHCSSFLCPGANQAVCDACVPSVDEPTAVASAAELPERPVPIEAADLPEPIDVLAADLAASSRNAEENHPGNEQGLVQAQFVVPALIEGEDVQLRVMPRCPDDEGDFAPEGSRAAQSDDRRNTAPIVGCLEDSFEEPGPAANGHPLADSPSKPPVR